jgi:hypothetical protein
MFEALVYALELLLETAPRMAVRSRAPVLVTDMAIRADELLELLA